MNEALLQYIWKYGLFDSSSLQTESGKAVQILHKGNYNTDAGPDFTEAKIKIEDVTWAGNIELHLRTSHWQQHRHTTNRAYDNVILHVVYEHDGAEIQNTQGRPIEVLALKPHVSDTLLQRYRLLLQARQSIPCASVIHEVDEVVVSMQLQKMLIERLEQKVEGIQQLLQQTNNDWEHVAFILLARYMGAPVNSQPFEQWARTLPNTLRARYAGQALPIEALVFGQAGMLDAAHDDEYPNNLRKEYLYLKRLHSLTPLQASQFKLLRLRPPHFPTVRLAQLAALMVHSPAWFAQLLECTNTASVLLLLQAPVHDYWHTHYVFDKPVKTAKTSLGKSQQNILLINAVVPLLFAYGKYKASHTYCDRALQWLEEIEAEKNTVITQWKALGMAARHAADTQALLQLKKHHCDAHRCLHCSIGIKILKRT